MKEKDDVSSGQNNNDSEARGLTLLDAFRLWSNEGDELVRRQAVSTSARTDEDE